MGVVHKVGSPTPFFSKTHRNLDLGMGKNYMKREGNKLSIFKIEKIPIFPMMRRNSDLGMEKMGKKVYGKREKVFVLTNFCTLLSLFSAF